LEKNSSQMNDNLYMHFVAQKKENSAKKEKSPKSTDG
jgi:hypothetical protein